MKKLVFKFSILILPILSLLAGLELFTRRIPNDYQIKNDYIQNNGDLIKILILGNSHSMYGINPNYFSQKTYNLAFLSQSVELDYEVYEHYKSLLKNVKLIVVPISYFTLFSTIESDHNESMIKNYSIYMGLPMGYSPAYNFEIFNDFPNPLVRKNYLYYIKNQSEILCQENGWAKKLGHRKYKSIETNAQEAFKRHSFEDTSKLAINILTLKKFITSLQQNNIQLLLVTTPTQHYYSDSVVVNNHYKIMTQHLAELAITYQNCRYINSIEDKRFATTEFYDGDHLNELGAKKYSIYLDSICVEILQTKKQVPK